MKHLRSLGLILSVGIVMTGLIGCGGQSGQPSDQSNSGTGTAAGKTAEEAAVKPVTLGIIDVAGSLQLVQASIDEFVSKNPNIVSDVEYIKATAPELASKLKAQQTANNLDTALVFTGFDGLASGLEQDVWEELLPKHVDALPNIEGQLLEGAKLAFDIGKGYAIPHAFCPGGPMFTYNPDMVKEVPKTAEDLLAFAKANPGKFLYARPSNSGPGSAFLQGLPYVLGDTDPKDPKTWDKTWAYLKELDQYIDYYPTGTGITFRELAEGTRWIIASHMGWDMNQRILGTIPQTFQGFFLDNSTWVADANFVAVPKGLTEGKLNATLKLVAFLMTPEQQAVTYDSGYMYPGPAIKDVPLSMAPKDSQDKVGAAMRDEYEKAIKDIPTGTQLEPEALVEAYDMWDKLVGAKVKK